MNTLTFITIMCIFSLFFTFLMKEAKNQYTKDEKEHKINQKQAAK
jgi:preprotein translocase subunit SecG